MRVAKANGGVLHGILDVTNLDASGVIRASPVGQLFLDQCMRPRLLYILWMSTMTTFLAHNKSRKAPPHPWEVEPVTRTIAREAPHMWPFAFGFFVTGYLFYKISSAVTDEDIERSKFSNPRD